MTETTQAADIFRNELIVPTDRIIVAYDGMNWPQIMETAEAVGPVSGLGKTNSAHVRPGADFAVEQLASVGQFTMLDSKFHDIPRTVGLAVEEATLAGASLITVHASGGLDMLKAAAAGAQRGKDGIQDAFKKKALPNLGHVLGITVLTSLEDEAYSIFGLDPNDKDAIQKKVIEFAHLALEAGLTGIVCSPLEAEAIRSNTKFDSLLVVTPAITPDFAKKEGDQARTTNATQAMEAGADLIVVGSAINKASDYGMTKPEAAEAIGEEIAVGLDRRAA